MCSVSDVVDRKVVVRARCCWSMRKNEEPHKFEVICNMPVGLWVRQVSYHCSDSKSLRFSSNKCSCNFFSFEFPFFPLVSHVVKFSFFCLEVITFFFASVVEDYRCISCFYCSVQLSFNSTSCSWQHKITTSSFQTDDVWVGRGWEQHQHSDVNFLQCSR